MSKSLYQKVGIASLIMMASVFLSRLIGLGREMVIAYAGGARGAVDAYQVAFVIPEILNHIVASGFLSVTFIPIFSNFLSRDQEEEGWKVFSIILTGFGTLLLIFILIAFVFTPQLVGIIAPGLHDPLLKTDAIRMTRIIMPAQFFFFVGGLFMAVQFSKEKFFIPALAPLLYNIGIIAGGIFLGPRLNMEGFAWGVLFGAFTGNFALQYLGARKIGLQFHLTFDFRHPELKKYILLTIPLMVGLTMTFSTEFFLKFFGSYLPQGSIAALNYSFRVMLILVGFFGQAVGVASFPFMARLAAENKIPEMNRLINTSLRYLALVIPFSVLLMVLRQEVVLLLFQRGKFDTAATALTSRLLIYILIGAFAFSAQTVVVRGFYAIQNTLFPAIFGTLAVLLSIPLYFYGMQAMGVNGVAMAISLSAVFQVMLLYGLWNRRCRNKESRNVYRFFIQIILLSIPIGILLEAFRKMVLQGIDPQTFSGSLIISVITGMVFIVILVSAGYLFRIEEIVTMIGRLTNKLRKT
ncbi:MAG: murein biosynthesis integral membrane protein MurJ [Desulfobacterales bacterium]|nr:murein biosynthesis integral membrane protein MurJ [Desulfobacterales bacterium]